MSTSKGVAGIQNLVPFKTSALFCSNCGMMLKLESSSDTCVCRFCSNVTSIKGKHYDKSSNHLDLVGDVVTTKK